MEDSVITSEDSGSAEEIAERNQSAASKEMTTSIGSSFVFCVLGIYMVVCGFRMPNSELTGSPSKWYIAPGLFPVFIGLGLTLMSLSLIAKSFMAIRGDGGTFTLSKLIPSGDRQQKKRLILAGVLLVGYVASLGKINFTVATAVFLFVTMFFFRAKEFALWKLLLISVLFSVAVTFGFGTLAKIPLP